MPRTKQPKMARKVKQDENSSLDSTSSSHVFRSTKEIPRALDDEMDDILKAFDKDLAKFEKEWEHKMKFKHPKEDVEQMTIQDFLNIVELADSSPEYARALQAVLDGTYMPPPASISKYCIT